MGMRVRKIEPIGARGLRDGQSEQFGKGQQLGHCLRITARALDEHAGIVRLDQPASDRAGIISRRGDRARKAQLGGARKPGSAAGRKHRGLAGDRQIDRSARLAHRDLQQPADHQPRIVLMLESMVGLGVVAHDAILVARLLLPLHERITGARHRPRKGARAGASDDHHRVTATPGGVQCCAIVKGPDIDMSSRRRGPPGDHRDAQRRIERDRLVNHRHQPGGRQAAGARLGDRLLKEIDLGAGNEKKVIDAAQLHRRDDRIGPFIARQVLPEGFGASRAPIVSRPLARPGGGDTGVRHHCSRMLLRRISGSQRWRSALISFANSSGDAPLTSMPILSKRSRISATSRAFSESR